MKKFRFLAVLFLVGTAVQGCQQETNESMSDNVYWVLEVAIKAGEFDNFKGSNLGRSIDKRFLNFNTKSVHIVLTATHQRP